MNTPSSDGRRLRNEKIDISAAFTSIAERATTSVHVLHNDKPLFDSLINLEGKGPECNYSGSVEVKKGDTIDCVCGWGNGDYGADTTALTVLVKKRFRQSVDRGPGLLHPAEPERSVELRDAEGGRQA